MPHRPHGGLSTKVTTKSRRLATPPSKRTRRLKPTKVRLSGKRGNVRDTRGRYQSKKRRRK